MIYLVSVIIQNGGMNYITYIDSIDVQTQQDELHNVYC